MRLTDHGPTTRPRPVLVHLLLLAVVASCARPPTPVERPKDAAPPMPEVADASPAVRRGAALYRTAACVGCHSPPFSDAEHLGGGRDLPTMFGLFYAPNISPSAEAGIGGWTEGDFVRAMREGRNPDGRSYWPTFPYMTYTNMSAGDLSDLWAYLSTQPAVETPSRPHEIRPAYRSPGLLGLWRSMAFREGPLEPEPDRTPGWNRGRYLVRAVSYCDQCHTPRSSLGLPIRRHDMAGGANPGKADVHPNLTPDPKVGLGSWSKDDIATYLGTARKPDGSVTPADDIMAEKIEDSFSFYSYADRLAIAEYLKSLPADDWDPEQWRVVRRMKRKAAEVGPQPE